MNTSQRRLALVAALAMLVGVAVAAPHARPSLATFTSSGTEATAVTARSAYDRAVLADGPMGYWPLDERSGSTAYDRTTNGHNGNYANDVGGTVAQTGASIPLNAGGSASFSGGKVALSGLPVPTAAGTKITVDFWMYLPTSLASSSEMIFGIGKTTAGTTSANLYFTSGLIGFNSGNGDILYTSSAGLFGRPVHVAMVIGNNTGSADYAANRTLYLDGTLQTLTQSGPPLGMTLTSTASIGGNPMDTNYRLTGGAQVSNLAIYNGALTAAQIQNHYYAGQAYANQVIKDGAVAYWKFDDATGSTTTTDFTQHGYTGTYPAGAQVGASSLIRDGGKAVNFNSAGPVGINIPTLSSAPGAITTIETWVDMPAQPPNNMAIQLGDYTIWSCPTCYNGGPGFGINASYSNIRGIAWSAALTGRHYVVVALTNGNQSAGRMWIDGVEQALANYGTMNPNPVITTVYAAFGGGNGAIGGTGVYAWPYRIDEVAVYNGLLPQAAITAHYNTGK